MKIINTKRLIVKPISKSFAQDILEYYIRNKSFLGKWSQKRDNNFYTLKEQEQRIKIILSQIKKGETIQYWIFLKSTGNLIGYIQFSNILKGSFQSCFLSYSLDKDEINKGIMTEALLPVIRYIFKTVNLHRIEANIMPNNLTSLKVVRKLGFKEEGLAKKYLKINGRWEDHLHMTLLNE